MLVQKSSQYKDILQVDDAFAGAIIKIDSEVRMVRIKYVTGYFNYVMNVQQHFGLAQ